MSKKEFKTKSGEVLKIRPVDEVLLASVIKQVDSRKPKPPVEVIQTANGPQEVANEAHSGYLEALENYQVFESLYVIAFYIQFGVSVKLTEEELEEVHEMQANRELVQPGALENKFLTYIYVSTICPTMEEKSGLVEAIKNLSEPSAGQVQQHLDAFRPDLQGPSNHEDKDAPQWNRLPEPEFAFDTLPGRRPLGN